MYETNYTQHKITSGFINIVDANHHHLPAFWAHPEIGGPFPGLVLIHEWWGLTAQIRDVVRHFAELGFYVIAPDLLNQHTPETAEEAYTIWTELAPFLRHRVAAAIDAIKTHHRCNCRIAVIGWQAGGELAYDAAIFRDDLAAAVVFYARPDHYLDKLAECQIPILAFYGKHDVAANPQMLIQIRDAIMRSPGHGEVIIYPEATTGFFNQERASFHPSAATDSWTKAVEFLCKHLVYENDEQTTSTS